MAYAQRDYLQKQGILLGDGSRNYRIDSIGCFLTADANLLNDFGTTVDPLTLNSEFVNRGIYIDIDDGIRDDLGWSSITQYDPSVIVTRTVEQGKERTAGWPTTNQAIVRFYYKSLQSGEMIFHFCKVADAAAQTIVDSWDGVIKTSPYGQPTAFAEYIHNAPVSIQPPAPKFTVVEEYVPAKTIRLNKQPTNLWGMNYDFEYMKDHPVEVHNAGETWEVTNKVHHQDGYDYYRRDGQVDGFNVADCDEVVPTPEVAPVVVDQPKLQVIDSTAPVTDVSAGETIPVKVIPAVQQPQYTPFADGNTWYHATKSIHVQDLVDITINQQLVENQPVLLAGTMTLNGNKYYRTAKSVQTGLFVAIPRDAVKLGQATDEELFGAITDDIKRNFANTTTETREAAVKKAGTMLGKFARLLVKLHIIKQRGK